MFFANLREFSIFDRATPVSGLPVRMIQLNFPPYEFRIAFENSRHSIFDPVRKKFVALTPEEWVRQHVIRFLVEQKMVPLRLIRAETWINLFKTRKRIDILVSDRNGNPLIIVECKAPSVVLGPDVLDQAVRYHMAMKAGYLMLTNGLQHVYCRIYSGGLSLIEELPEFQDLR
jgi:hypothetical protein